MDTIESKATRPATKRTTAAAAPTSPVGPSEAEIAWRAYELWLQRNGSGSGSELEDWLQAERELLTAAKPARARKKAA